MARITISIDVPDLDEAQNFYCNALGCRFLERKNGMRIIKADNVNIYLLSKAEESFPFRGARSPRSYERHWCPIHLDFETNDMNVSIDLVKDHGGTIEGSDSGSWGSITFCADPFGNGFCLVDE